MPDPAFTEKVEAAIEGVIGFLRRFTRTLRLLATRPVRAPGMLLGPEPDSEHLPPLTFAVVAYAIGAASVTLLRNWPSGLEQKYSAIGKALDSDNVSPEALLALALPILAVLLGCALAIRRLTGLERRTAIGVIAYSATPWLLVLVSLFALLSIGELMDWFSVSFSTQLLVQLVLSIPILAGVLISAGLFLRGTVLLVAAERSGGRKAGAAATVILAILVAHYLGVRLIVVASAEPPTTRVAMDIYDVWLGADSVRRLAASPPEEEYLPVPTGWATVTRSPHRFRIHMSLILENHTSDPVYIPWEPIELVGRLHALSISPPLSVEDSKAPDRVAFDIPLRIVRWADPEGPILILKPNDVKWIVVEAFAPGITTVEEFEEFTFRVQLASSEGEMATSWEQAIAYTVRTNELPRPDSALAVPTSNP